MTDQPKITWREVSRVSMVTVTVVLTPKPVLEAAPGVTVEANRAWVHLQDGEARSLGVQCTQIAGKGKGDGGTYMLSWSINDCPPWLADIARQVNR